MIADRTAYTTYTVCWQTVKPVSVTNFFRTAGTHDPIQRVEFMNTPKLCLLNRDRWACRQKFSSSRSQWKTERNTTSARLIVYLKKLTFEISSIGSFGAFCGSNVATTTKMSEGTNRNLPVRNTLVNFLALYTDSESHNTQRYRQTDGRHNDANRRSYCIAVRSAKTIFIIILFLQPSQNWTI